MISGNSNVFKLKAKGKTEGNEFKAKDKIKQRGNVVKEKLKIKTKKVLAEGENYNQGDVLLRFEKEYVRGVLHDLVAEDPDVFQVRQYSLGTRLFEAHRTADFEEVGGGIITLVERRSAPKFQLIFPGYNRLPKRTYNLADVAALISSSDKIEFVAGDGSQHVKIRFRDTWDQAKFRKSLVAAIVSEQGLTPVHEVGESAEEEGEALKHAEEQEQEADEESNPTPPGQAGAFGDDELPRYEDLFGPTGAHSHGEEAPPPNSEHAKE